MELEQLAERFEMVRMTGRGFTCRCPAHDDKNPSLTIARGETGWLTTCWSGCGFFDIVSSAGLRPLDFKFRGSDSLATSRFEDRTREIMRDMIRETRDIKWTFGQLMVEAFSLDVDDVREVLIKYPEFMLTSLPDAMKMHAVMFAGPVADLIGDRYYPQYDQEAKGRIGERLWQEYRTQQSSLV